MRRPQKSTIAIVIGLLSVVGMIIVLTQDDLRNATAQASAAWYNVGRPADQPASAYITDISMVSSTEGWLTTSQGMAKYTSGTWSFQTATQGSQVQSPVVKLDMIDASNGWAVGYSGSLGTIWRYQNNAWSVYTSTYDVELQDIDMITTTDGWAVGEGGHIAHYDGTQWASFTSPTQFYLTSVSMFSSSAGWAGGDNGTMLMYDGTAWTQQNFPAGSLIMDVLAVSATEAWALGGPSDPLFHYTQGAWTTVTNPATSGLFALDGNASEWWAAGEEFVHYVNGVLTTESLPSAQSCGGFVDKMATVAYVSTDDVWAGGLCGELRHYYDPAQANNVPSSIPPDLVADLAFLPILRRVR